MSGSNPRTISFIFATRQTMRTHLLLFSLLFATALPALAFRDLEAGTFLSRDPAGFVDGPNLYSYVVDNPWTKFDPEGLSWMDTFAPATASTAGPSPYGGERGAMQHSAAVTRPMLGIATATGAAVATAPAVVASAVVSAPGAVAAAISTAAIHPVATAAVVEAGVVGGVVYHDTGDAGAAISSAMLTGANAWANGGGGKSPSGSAKDTKGQSEVEVAKSAPAEPYNRRAHYGNTPTAADRKAVGAGEGEVANHEPPLVQRYYEGDPAAGEVPGYKMTPEQRAASAGDRSRISPQAKTDSNKQGAAMSRYSQQKKQEHFNDKKKD